MSLTSRILKVAAPVPHVMDFQKYLFIGPHPDDIEIGAGATIAALRKAGKDVCFLIATDGRYGLEFAPEGTTPEALASIRQAEAREAAGVLGVTDVRFLNFSDGGLYDTGDLYGALARETGSCQPVVIFAPDPDVRSECHADHLNVGNAAKRLAFFTPFREIMAHYGAKEAPVKAIAFYMTARPNRFLKTSKTFKDQMRAIGCHKSQFPAGSKAYAEIEKYLKLRGTAFGFRKFAKKAEGFRVLGVTHMPCLPEAEL